MIYEVNGNPTDLIPSDVRVEKVGDRWLVRTSQGTKSALVIRHGDTVHVSFDGRTYRIQPPHRHRDGENAVSSGTQRAPLPGQVVEVNVVEGESVEIGQRLVVVEAMKMQQAIVAPFAGLVSRLPVMAGDKVAEGDLLVEVTPLEDSE
ncbi:MAG: hypothetical protein KF812_04985 [Fimbriimonadaceae bacterium]|nr:hypothetical protein [Fimbriimonadaceae bacterium]